MAVDARKDGHNVGGTCDDSEMIRTILNIIWLVLSGWILFLGYMLAGILLSITIIGIPWAIASFRIANYALWPFGRRVVPKETAGFASMLGNIVWLILAGWWLAVLHIITGIAQCVTIIGIPMGIADFKMIPVSLMPIGTKIVSTRTSEFDKTL